MFKDEREDLIFINDFSKIKLTDACKHFNIDYSNLKYGKSTKENEKKVRKYIENKIAKLYLKETNNYVEKDDSLHD